MIVAVDAGITIVGVGVAAGAQGIPVGIGVGGNGCSATIYLLAYQITIVRRTMRFMAVCAGQDIIFLRSIIRRFPAKRISFAPTVLPTMNAGSPINIPEVGVAQPRTNRCG